MNITVQKSGQVLTRFSLERGPIIIGSGSAVHVNLPLPTIPKRQAILLQDAKGRWYLEDLGSGGRTLLNGKPARRARLHGGDRIDIGPFRILIKSGKSDSQAPVAKAPAKLAELPETAIVRYPEDLISLRAVTARNIQDIAAKLELSMRTVKAHLSNIFNKMRCSCRTEAIVKGFREGYVSLDDVPAGIESIPSRTKKDEKTKD